MNKFLYKYRYQIAIIAILLVAVFFRFYNYPNRWGLGSDQARDAIIVRRSILLHKFPLIGPFSASGPFVFASTWYIIFIFLTAIYPQAILTPWIMQSILFVGVVLLMIVIGYKIGGKKLSLILGIFTAISPAQLAASTNLIFSSLENISCAIVLFFLVSVLQYKKPLSYFFLGVSIGLAITVHFQALPLLIIFPAIIFLTKPSLNKILLTIIGFCIPFIPLLIFDLQTNFYETRHLITYFFFTNKPVQPGIRWLTYLFSFWPGILANIVGGAPLLAYVSVGIFFYILDYLFLKRRLSGVILTALCSFGIIFIFLRYFSGQLFEGFLSFLQPFILFIFAWICFQLIKINKVAGYVFTTLLIIGSSYISFTTITHMTNNTALEAVQLQKIIEKEYQQQKYAIYDYQYESTSISLPLALFIYMANENQATGKRIGISLQKLGQAPLIGQTTNPDTVYLYDLNFLTPAQLQKQWTLVNPLAVYSSVEEWYKK